MVLYHCFKFHFPEISGACSIHSTFEEVLLIFLVDIYLIIIPTQLAMIPFGGWGWVKNID